jgi:hypothetical protein
MVYLYALLITGAMYAARWFYDRPEGERELSLSPSYSRFLRGHLTLLRWTWDSDKYIRGHLTGVWRPFHRRPLIPLIAQGNTKVFHGITAASLILTGPLLAWYLVLHGLSTTQALYGVLAYTSLWGVFGLLVLCPVLVDAPSTLLGLLGACWWLQTGDPWGLIFLGLLSGTVKEQGPIFMALYAWSPLPLIGLLFTAYADYKGAPMPEGQDHIFALHHPFAHAQCFRNLHGTFHPNMVASWGLLLPLAMLHPTTILWVTLAVAYGQLMMASDLSRLYQQAFPVVILSAFQVPGLVDYWPVILLGQLVSPWQKNTFEAQPITIQRLAEELRAHA